MVRAVFIDQARRLGREIQQRLDGAGGGLAGPKLQHLTEENQNGNDRGGLKIDRDPSVVAPERGRENAGR